MAEAAPAEIPSREQLLFMLEFSDAQGEFIDPFEIQAPAGEPEVRANRPPNYEADSPEGQSDAHDD